MVGVAASLSPQAPLLLVLPSVARRSIRFTCFTARSTALRHGAAATMLPLSSVPGGDTAIATAAAAGGDDEDEDDEAAAAHATAR